MIVDTSALVAIVSDEPTKSRLLTALSEAAIARISAANLLEAYFVIDGRKDQDASAMLDALLRRLALTVEPVTEAQVVIARGAFRRFGKGSGHPARLNYGDCFAYALARAMDESLLFVGNDFSHTDIRRSL